MASRCDVVVIYPKPNEPAKALSAELTSLQKMVTGWHYLLVDGMQCTAPSGGLHVWGATHGDKQCDLAQSVWEDAARNGVVKSFECRLDTSPGWCLGSYQLHNAIEDALFAGGPVTRAAESKGWIGGKTAFLNGVCHTDLT